MDNQSEKAFVSSLACRNAASAMSSSAMCSNTHLLSWAQRNLLPDLFNRA
jgi:hypothetical protein